MRIVGALAALAFVVTALVGVQPSEKASATTSWPVAFDGGGVGRVVAFGEDHLTALTCDGTSDYYVVTSDSITPYSSVGTFTCDGSRGSALSDGTVFGTYTTGGVHYFAAVKNGRVRWATLLRYDYYASCSDAGANMTPTSITQGADGNVYFIANSTAYDCNKYLVGLNSSTGQPLFTPVSLGWLGLGSYGWGVVPQVFTYNDYLTVVNTSGLLMEFAYDGIENTTAEYQFGSTDGTVVANKDGRVFLFAPNTGAAWSGWTNGTIYFHDHDGTTGSRSRNDAGGPNYTYGVTADGGLLRYGTYQSIQKLDMDGTNTSLTVALPSGYSGGSDSFTPYYAQDAAGNAILVRLVVQSGTSHDSVLVDYIDSSGNVTNLYTRDSDGTWADAAYPYNGDVGGGYFYQPVLESVNLTTGSSHTSVQKLTIPGTFGDALNITNNFVTSLFTHENYVAMGDSYSSGEGNYTFNPYTNVSGGDQCHRSSQSYPELLTAVDTPIKLTDFVACSGATTNDVRGISEADDPIGKGGEPDQLSALNDQTNVVSITIGGNDVGFAGYVSACAVGVCGSGTTAYTNITTAISSSTFNSDLIATYSAILSDAKYADVYILDYPYVVTDDSSNTCQVLWTSADDSAAYDVVTLLNEEIYSAYDSIKTDSGLSSTVKDRLHLIDVNGTGSPFATHNICGSGGSYFYAYTGAGTGTGTGPFHPTQYGQAAYANLLYNTL